MDFNRRLPVAFIVCLVLFFASALLGALISYNTTLAWSRLLLIVISLAVCVLFATLPDRAGFSWMFVVLPVALIVYFALTNDWTVRLGKVAWLDPILRWFATWQPRIPGLALDSNSFGGALAMLIPLQIAVLVREKILGRVPSIAFIAVSILGLIVSASRGAWVASGLVAWSVVSWYVLARVMPGSRVRLTIWFAFIVMTIGVPLALTPLGAALLDAGGGHWDVARNSLDLVSDYPFTGIGLGAFTMAYSSYVLLVHVPHTIHAHNLFLDIWLEQGLLGLLAFVGLIIAGVLNISSSRWRIAALASLGVVLVHGLLDDAFYGYGGNAIPFLLVPLGLLARREMSAENKWRASWRWAIAPGALVVLAVLPITRSMFVANLAALDQTRTELSVYSWPTWGIQDQVRRAKQNELAPIIAQYQEALMLDAQNASAQRRLAQIEISLGAYDSAQKHLQAMHTFAPSRAATQMLGEVHALAGNPACAASLWRTIDTSVGQLEIRQWWYEQLGDKERATSIQRAIQSLARGEGGRC